MIKVVSFDIGGTLLEDSHDNPNNYNLKELAKIEDMIAYEFEGKRYDVGDKLGFLQATVEFALKNDELKESFAEYVKEISGRI